MLGCQGLAGLDGEGRVFPTATGVSLPYLCFSLGSFSLAKPSSFPWPRFCLCVGHTWLRSASVTSLPSTLDSLPCSSFWAQVGLWGKEVPVGSCREEGTVLPLPGWACRAVCPVTALRPRAAQQEGRGREAEVLCCCAGAIFGEILG